MWVSWTLVPSVTLPLSVMLLAVTLPLSVVAPEVAVVELEAAGAASCHPRPSASTAPGARSQDERVGRCGVGVVDRAAERDGAFAAAVLRVTLAAKFTNVARLWSLSRGQGLYVGH